jgi:uncharacterized protein (DUF1778 family)
MLARAYLEQPADDRLETRLPRLLKRHAEAVAKARGETLSEYLVALLAERVAKDIAITREWNLTADEQAELLKILATPAVETPSLKKAMRRAEALFGS